MAFLCFYTYYICAKLHQYHGLEGRRITDVTTQITETVRFLSCKASGQIFIHRFPLSRIRNMLPRKHNSAHMATHTPTSPKRGASRTAKVSRTPHMLTRFSTKQPVLSPAPCTPSGRGRYTGNFHLLRPTACRKDFAPLRCTTCNDSGGKQGNGEMRDRRSAVERMFH